MKERRIYVTALDLTRLETLIASRKRADWGRDGRLDELREELDRAEVLAPQDMPPDAVTMHSTVRLRDLTTQQDLTYVLVYPHEADIDRGRISVLAPIGTAMLGYRTGDVFEWRTPGGMRRMRILSVLLQPELATAS